MRLFQLREDYSNPGPSSFLTSVYDIYIYIYMICHLAQGVHREVKARLPPSIMARRWQTVKAIGQTVKHWKSNREGVIVDISACHMWIVVAFVGKHSKFKNGWPVIESRRSSAFE